MNGKNSIVKTFNIKIGELIRKRRKELLLTQKSLGMKLRLTSQQIQKYENGVNCLRIDKFIEFSKVLDVPPTYFFISEIVDHYNRLKENEKEISYSYNQQEEISMQEIDKFFLQFLSLDNKFKKHIMALVSDLASKVK
jgi:transcriptional regulator with XRE-family HTH domain